MTSGEIIPLAKKMDDLRTYLQKDSVRAQFEVALPRVGLTAERFIRATFTALQRTPKLAECTRDSLMGCLILSAQSGLSPSGISGEAYILPFENRKKGVTEATFIPGFRGLMKIARRSGEVLSFSSEVVHEKDEFSFKFGSNARLDHIPAKGDRGDPTYVWALAKLKGGGEQFTVMTVEDIERVRKSSKASQNGPWVTHWGPMAQKTCLRRLCKYLPISDDDMRLVELAGLEEAGMPQEVDLGSVVDTTAEVDGFKAPPHEAPKAPAPAPAPKAAPPKVAEPPAAAAKPDGTDAEEEEAYA